MDQDKIGKFIAECRKDRNLTQEQLGEMIGVTSKSVSRWENGRTMPDISLLRLLCDKLNITLNELFAGKHLKKDEVESSLEQNILTMVKKENKNRKKVKTILFVLIFIVIILLGIAIGLYNYMVSYMSVSKTFELNWGIILPSDFKENYYVDTGTSFHGDGERYSVFTGKSFITSLKNNKNSVMEKEISNFYDELNVPKKEQINFTHDYSWTKLKQDSDERNYIYCVFDKELNKYYFYEFFC